MHLCRGIDGAALVAPDKAISFRRDRIRAESSHRGPDADLQCGFILRPDSRRQNVSAAMRSSPIGRRMPITRVRQEISNP